MFIKLLGSVLWLLLVTSNFAFADCKEYKLIEHKDSVEAVCVGEPSTTGQSKTQSQTTSYQDQLSSQKPKYNDKSENERCTLQSNICKNGCSSGYGSSCYTSCQNNEAECMIAVLSNSSDKSMANCKKRCTLESNICKGGCSKGFGSSCYKSCQNTESSCQMNCL